MKLRHLAATSLAALISSSSFAGSTVTSVIAVPFQAQRATAIALVQPADYVCATVSISSREKDHTRQADEVRNAIRLLESTVAKSPQLQLHQGPLRFNVGSRQKDSSFSLLSSSSSYNSGPLFGSTVRVLAKLDGNTDPFAAAGALRKLIDDIKAPNLTDISLVNVTLAVDSPERQRERILTLIRDSADAMKKTFGADQITVGGLDGPVLVRQVDDASVELFIDYQLSVTTGK